MTLFDFLQWVFMDFWRFVGLVIIIGVTGNAIAQVILACKGINSDKD